MVFWSNQPDASLPALDSRRASQPSHRYPARGLGCLRQRHRACIRVSIKQPKIFNNSGPDRARRIAGPHGRWAAPCQNRTRLIVGLACGMKWFFACQRLHQPLPPKQNQGNAHRQPTQINWFGQTGGETRGTTCGRFSQNDLAVWRLNRYKRTNCFPAAVTSPDSAEPTRTRVASRRHHG
jgi:hypothetical protein